MADSKSGPELHPVTVELAQGPNFGAITTMLPSGNLQTQYIRVGTDGERVVVKPRCIARSTRTSRPVSVPGALRLLVEVAVFGSAVAALYATGRPNLAWTLGLSYAVNRVLMFAWDQ